MAMFLGVVSGKIFQLDQLGTRHTLESLQCLIRLFTDDLDLSSNVKVKITTLSKLDKSTAIKSSATAVKGSLLQDWSRD